MKLGNIEVMEQQAMTKFTQEAASAWSYFDGSMVGAGYKPIALAGTQLVRGLNYIFIAEQTLILENPVRHIVLVTINKFNDKYSTVSIETII